MTQDVLNEALTIARDQNMVPVYVGNSIDYLSDADNREVSVKILNSETDCGYVSEVQQVLYVFDNFDEIKGKERQPENYGCILVVTEHNVDCLCETVKAAANVFSNVNVIKRDFAGWGETTIEHYNEQIRKMKYELDSDVYQSTKISPFFSNDQVFDCQAGESSFVIAPNGYVYPCPAFYFSNPDVFLCHISKLRDYNFSNSLYSRKRSPVCSKCNNEKCRRCVFDNKCSTGNANIPSYKQCAIAKIESE